MLAPFSTMTHGLYVVNLKPTAMQAALSKLLTRYRAFRPTQPTTPCGMGNHSSSLLNVGRSM